MNPFNMNVKHCAKNWYLAICFCLILPFHAKSQETNKSTYDFDVRNKPLNEVLDKLSDLTSIHFTYNSNEPSFNHKISYKANSKPFDEILKDILDLSNQQCKKIGNQWVIYAKEVIVETPVEVALIPEQKVSRPVESHTTPFEAFPVGRPDTIVLKDTVILKETITHTDTIVIKDTIVVIKEVRHNRKPGFRNFPKDFFQFDPNRSDGLFLGLSYGQYFGGIQNLSGADNEELQKLTNDSEALSFRNYSLGVDIGYSYKKWALNIGLGLKGFSNRFKYNQLITSGGYYRHDTVTWYYNVVEMDTTWFAITDSTYLPFEKVEVNYNQLNRVGLLDLQLGVAYTWFAYANTRLYIKGGLGYSLMVYNDGILLQNKLNFPGMDYDDANMVRNRMTYQFGTGINYMAGNTFDLFTEIGYQGYSKNLIDNYPIDKRLFSFGLKAGVVFYL